jgi:hypothetical protein
MPEIPSLVTDALEFQKFSAEVFAQQRQRELDDLACQVPEKLWPEDVAVQRRGQVIGGVKIPARPMISIPKLDQPIQLVYNQWARAHYGVRVHPLSLDADDDTAEVIQGLYRSIEVDSRAYIARGWAFDRAIKAGIGWYRVNTTWDDATDDPFDQKIVIERILRQSNVYADPYATEPDFSNAERGLIVSVLSWGAYQRAFSKDARKARGSTYDGDPLEEMNDSDLDQLASTNPFWISGSGKDRRVTIGEYFYTEWKTRDRVRLTDGGHGYADETDQALIDGNGPVRPERVPTIHVCKITATEKLESTIWNGRYLPLIPVLGKELQPFDEERWWTGIIGPNKDSARLFNYEVSGAVEKDALATKSPWIGPVGTFKTNQAAWDQASTRNFSKLEYDLVVGPNGQLGPPPQRNLQSVDLSSSIALIQIANQNIQAGTALYDPSLGNTGSQSRSGRAVLAEQQQGDLSNSHFVESMANVSMTYEAKVILDLMAKIYDRPGRVAELIGQDDDRRLVKLNEPYQEDPQTKRPMSGPMPQGQRGQPQMGPMATGNGHPPQPKTLTYDLKKGRYGVVVDVGQSYQTRLQQGADAFGKFLEVAPQLMPLLGDLWFQFQDFPGHTEAADRLHKMLPPQVSGEDGQGPTPEQMQAQLQQASQMVQAMQQRIQELEQAEVAKQVQVQGQLQKAQIDAQAKLSTAERQDATKVQLAQIKAQLDWMLAQFQAKTDFQLQNDEQRHEVAMRSAEPPAPLPDGSSTP